MTSLGNQRYCDGGGGGVQGKERAGLGSASPGGMSGDLPALPPFICGPLTLQPTFCSQPWVLPHPLGSQKTCGTIKTSWWGSWTLREKGEKPEVPPSLASESRRAVSAQTPASPRPGLRTEVAPSQPPPQHTAGDIHRASCSVRPRGRSPDLLWAEFNTCSIKKKKSERQRTPPPGLGLTPGRHLVWSSGSPGELHTGGSRGQAAPAAPPPRNRDLCFD